MPDGGIVVEIPNSLRHTKLSNAVATVVSECKSGNTVVVRNSGEFSVTSVTVVEQAKKALTDEGLRVFQANSLDYEPVYTPTNEEDPLAKPKIHHYRTTFVVRLSLSPLDMIEGDTHQISEPNK